MMSETVHVLFRKKKGAFSNILKQEASSTTSDSHEKSTEDIEHLPSKEASPKRPNGYPQSVLKCKDKSLTMFPSADLLIERAPQEQKKTNQDFTERRVTVVHNEDVEPNPGSVNCESSSFRRIVKEENPMATNVYCEEGRGFYEKYLSDYKLRGEKYFESRHHARLADSEHGSEKRAYLTQVEEVDAGRRVPRHSILASDIKRRGLPSASDHWAFCQNKEQSLFWEEKKRKIEKCTKYPGFLNPENIPERAPCIIGFQAQTKGMYASPPSLDPVLSSVGNNYYIDYLYEYYQQQRKQQLKESLQQYYDPYGLTGNDFADAYLRQKLYEDNKSKNGIPRDYISSVYNRSPKDSEEFHRRPFGGLYNDGGRENFMTASPPTLFTNTASLDSAQTRIMRIYNTMTDPRERHNVHKLASFSPAVKNHANREDAAINEIQKVEQEKVKDHQMRYTEEKTGLTSSDSEGVTGKLDKHEGTQIEGEAEKETIPGESKPIACRVCNKTFNRSSNLYTHMRTHSPNKPHACEFCGKRFHQKADLRIHRYIHTGEKPHKCTKCGRAFKQLTHLKYHLRTHSDVRMYKCPYCERGFNQKSNLQAHIYGHTGQRPHKCDVCGKGFTLASTLNTHKRTHLPSKPFKCEFCDKAFYQKNALKMHYMSTHPYSSGVCGL